MAGFSSAGWGKLTARFTTKSSRFRCAVTAGFAVTAIGAATLASGGTGSADDFFGALGNIFSAQPAFQQYSQQSYAPQYAAHARPRYARRHATEVKPKLASTRHGAPVRLGRLSMCVRTCDGFAFPVGAYHGEADRASHEATCQSECPGAQTALYVLPNGADSIGDAIEVTSGRSYSQMPHAFHYTTYLEDSCSCHPREGNRISSLLRDFTLRRGDAVMTKTGFKVFHGGERYPYRQGDFVALSKSRDVHQGQRATFHAIERASLTGLPAIVGSKPLAPAANATVPALEKQASLTP